MKSDHWLIFYDFLKVFPIGCHGNQSSSLISNLLAILRKDHPRIIPMKFQWNWTTGLGGVGFLSFSNRLPWQPEFFMDFNSFSYFEKGSPKHHSYKVSMKLDYWLRRSRLFCKILSFSNRLPWQPEFFMDFNSFSCFEKGQPKDHSYKVSIKLDNWLRRSRLFKFFQLVAMATRVLHGFQFV